MQPGNHRFSTSTLPAIVASATANSPIGWPQKSGGERAEKLASHIQKGMHLLIIGRPEAMGFKKADGTAAGELVLHAAELEFLSAKPTLEEEQPTDTVAT